MRLVFCDDNRILCEALSAVLEERGHQVLAVTATAAAVLPAVAKHKPDLCILDLYVPAPADGLAAAHSIRAGHPETDVLVLSNLTDPRVWAEARRAGLAGFLGKDKKIGQIADALDVIAAGGEVFDLPRGLPRREAARAARHAPYALTPREKEVLRRIVAGQTTRQMAGEMGIEISTLRTYVKTLLTKLGVHTRLAAAALATREDLHGDRLGAALRPARQPGTHGTSTWRSQSSAGWGYPRAGR